MRKCKFRIWKHLVAWMVILASASCEDFVAVPDPGTGIISKDIFASDATALATVSTIYGRLASSGSFANGELSLLLAAYTDDLTSYSSVETINEFYLNTITSSTSFLSSTWGLCYNNIFSCNLIIEGLKKPNGVSVEMQRQLMGEALFLRAFSHLYLALLFGDVPVIKTSDYNVNTYVSRESVEKVYDAVIEDLMEAKTLLTDAYPTEYRARANKGAAIALLARTYLYAGKYADAEAQATEIIEKTAQYKLHDDLNIVFLKTSSEVIWQLAQVDKYTNEGRRQIIVAVPPPYAALRSNFYNSFEPDDLRKVNWTDSITSESGFSTWYYAFKYKENTVNGTGAEYSVVMRLAEQYLIRAEARARLNNLTGPNSAESDLNIIRSRAGLPDATAATQEELLTTILQERRVELFTEWGHRFSDLRRFEKLDAILAPVKPNWKSTHALFPIPQSELLLNPNLKPQNPGY